LILVLTCSLWAQDDYEKWLKEQQQAQQQAFDVEISEFQNYVAEVTAEYDAYEQQEAKEFEEFKKAVEEKWQDFKAPSQKEYVDYDEDLNSRSSVDFENGVIVVEVIIEEDEPENSEEKVEKPKKEVRQKAKETVTQKQGKKVEKPKAETFQERWERQKAEQGVREKPKVEARQKAKKVVRGKAKEVTENHVSKKLEKKISKLMKIKADDGKPLLRGQIADKKGKTVKESGANSFAAELVKEKPIAKKTYKAKDGKKRTVYTVKIPMKSDHLSTRAKQFKEEVLKQSKRFNIDPIIAFAVMETESAFNTKAKSHIPAFGLMQLVPRSGARDAYLYVYKKDKFVDDEYLYVPSNNVELGCAYLAKIRHHYFKSITDDERAYICVIPAYNTGIGNVAKALTNDTKLKPAAQKANAMSADQLYKTLIKDLKYKEARDYLGRVWARKDKYVNLIE
jgi:membrane-bound lytic murein transglycosylase C